MPMEDFYDAAFVSRVGRSLRGFGVIAPRSDSLNNRGYVGGVFSYLSADSGVVFFSGSCSPGSRSSSSQLRLQDGAGRCGAAAVCPEMQPVCSQQHSDHLVPCQQRGEDTNSAVSFKKHHLHTCCFIICPYVNSQ